MVIYLHDREDELAGNDLRDLYLTRTLQAIRAVHDNNVRGTVVDIINAGCSVVLPHHPERRTTAPMLKVLRCLEILRIPMMTLPEYMESLLDPPALDKRLGVRQPEPSGVGSGLALPAG